MPHNKPYKRLWRPVKGYKNTGWIEVPPPPSIDYLLDDRFVDQREMRSMVTTAHLIIQDIYEVFNYIEPSDANLNTYSHRIYELLLRTSTEFESNCKAILSSNGYHTPSNFTIQHYFKITQFAKLSEYKVTFDRWSTNRIFQPFAAWNTGSYSVLPWYQAYNNVKHNRYSNFNQANMEHLMNAISGLLCILHAQYGENMADACFEGIYPSQESEAKVSTGTFEISTPTFPEADMYDFNWNDLKTDPTPILPFNFV